jgi:uncharacterized protein YbjT (DUF2867 family)
MRVGIVGGSGNVSAPVVRLLLARGHEVICITRGNSTLPDGARTMTGDRNDLDWFISAVKQVKF